MPSKRKKGSKTIHEVPCTQEDRLVRIEEDMGEQGKCLIRIEEKLKGGFATIGKIDTKLEHLVEGNSSPGLPTKVSNLEQKQEIMEKCVEKHNRLLWMIILLTLGGLVTGFVSLWPKA